MSRSFLYISLAVLFCLGILGPGIPLRNLFPGAHKASPEPQALSEIGTELGKRAAVSPSSSTPAARDSAKPMNPGEMERFFDPAVAGILAKYSIPGGTVSVVQDGRVIFIKGYGLANVEKNVPVRAEQTLFRIGSTSKLFTWTAVMQLVEQGKLDLDTDVNTYLRDFQIPSTFAQPVTLRHLMTHTAGFEEWNQGMVADAPITMLPLRAYLARYVPARVRAPGQVTAYSNYGSALAGYLVEQVSGVPFETYIEANIFRPLGMARSTFRQPLPAGLAQNLANGYKVSNGSINAEPFTYVNAGPAGAMSSTAEDMARFMMAHLQDGTYGNIQILQLTTTQQMHQRQFANDPRLNGFTLGFFDILQNQQHVLEHGGSLPPYNTMLALLPDQNIGVFVSFNGANGMTAPAEIWQAFLDHFYPVRQGKSPVPPADFSARAARFVGSYRITRSNYTKAEKATFLYGLGYGSISASPDGTLRLDLHSPRGSITGVFVETSPLVFQEVAPILASEPEILAFREDGNGRIAYLFLNSTPHWALEKISWYDTPQFNRFLLLASLANTLSVFLAFLFSWFLPRRMAARRGHDQARAAALVFSILVILLSAGVWRFQADGIVSQSPINVLKALQTLTFGLPILAALLAGFAIQAWIRKDWSLAGRIHFSMVAVLSVGSIWFLYTCNLIGYR